MFLFSRLIWDVIHTWSGVAMIAAAALHFAIHWKWAVKVTRKMAAAAVQTLAPSSNKQPVSVHK
jgi:hypothetical protein